MPRSASIHAKTSCHFAVLEKEDFKNVISKMEEAKKLTFIEFLENLPFLKGTYSSKIEILYNNSI